jgi:glutathione peroxidase
MKRLFVFTVPLVLIALLLSPMKMSNLLNLPTSPLSRKAADTKPTNATAKASFYNFKLKSLDGKQTIDFGQYKGKKVVILNVASKCGYTPQYADWQRFHQKYGDKVVVLGFPANDFMSQEPGSNAEIGEFCQKNYGVSFQMFEKIQVTGSTKHPLFAWLSSKQLNGWNDKEPTWNFCKYVVNENGELTNFFGSAVKPTDDEFKKAIGL